MRQLGHRCVSIARARSFAHPLAPTGRRAHRPATATSPTESAESHLLARILPRRRPNAARNAGLLVTGVTDTPLPLTSVTGCPAFRTASHTTRAVGTKKSGPAKPPGWTYPREPVPALIGRRPRPWPCRTPARNAGLPVTGVTNAPLQSTSVTSSPAFRTGGHTRRAADTKGPASANLPCRTHS